MVSYFDPRSVILFGSAARGDIGPHSDLDLLVLLDDDAPAERLSWRASHEARRDYGGSVDIIPCRNMLFRERARVIGSFAHTIAREGVVVYERA